MQRHIVEVAFNVPVDSVFDYEVPPGLIEQVCPGRRLSAPFGPRMRVGYCVRVKHSSPHPTLKRIRRVLDPHVSVSKPLMDLAVWISEHYLEPLGVVLEAMLPASVRKGPAKERRMRAARLCVPPEEARRVAGDIRASFGAQAAVLETLAECDAEIPVQELARKAGVSAGVVSTLARKGLVALLMREGVVPPADEIAIDAPSVRRPKLTGEQQTALAAIRNALGPPTRPLLIHGVTSCGKTEVYLRAIEEVVSAGREAIVLVPEISLTPQIVSRFAARFDHIAVLHSGLTQAQRRREWLRISRGEVQVVIGARRFQAIVQPKVSRARSGSCARQDRGCAGSSRLRHAEP